MQSPDSPQNPVRTRSGALRSAARHAGAFALGLMLALAFFYVLYRIGLPSKPFIYVAF